MITFTKVSGPGTFVGGVNTCTTVGAPAPARCRSPRRRRAPPSSRRPRTSSCSARRCTARPATRTPATAATPRRRGSTRTSRSRPATANNPVGTNHVLTITVTAINGTIDAGPHTATASIVERPGQLRRLARPAPTRAAAATASCTVTITSATAGTTVVSATSEHPGQRRRRSPARPAPRRTRPPAAAGTPAKNWADSTIVTHVRNAANADITERRCRRARSSTTRRRSARRRRRRRRCPHRPGRSRSRSTPAAPAPARCVATDANKPLSGGTATSANFTTPASGGSFSYLAHYNGDANYPGHDAACEPFSVEQPPAGPDHRDERRLR